MRLHAPGGPTNRIARIESLEFLEMYELLQKTWLPYTMEDTSTQAITLRLPHRSTPDTDTSVWVECYCLMASVLGDRYLASASNFWAYLRRIVRCARTFDCQNWVTYDSLYYRQAAATRSLSWATDDQSLYNKVFSGKAKPVARCKFCLSKYHSSDTFFVGQPEAPASRPSSQDVCRRYNQDRCFASSCK